MVQVLDQKNIHLFKFHLFWEMKKKRAIYSFNPYHFIVPKLVLNLKLFITYQSKCVFFFECLNVLTLSLNPVNKLLLFKQYKSIYTLQWYKSKFKNIFDHLNLADTIQNIFIKKILIRVYLDKMNCGKTSLNITQSASSFSKWMSHDLIKKINTCIRYLGISTRKHLTLSVLQIRYLKCRRFNVQANETLFT